MLCLLCGLFESLKCHPILSQIDRMLLLEVFDEPVDDPHVEIFTSQERVTGG